MKKKIIKTTIIIIIVVSIVFVVFVKNKKESEEKEYYLIYSLYESIEAIEYGSKNPMAVVKFPNVIKEDPPLIQMNGYKGLYISVMAYEYYTGNNIDYLEIEEWMDSGKFEEVNNKYSDYILWVWQNKQNIQGYLLKVCKIGYQHGYNLNIDSNYNAYKKVIDSYPDEIEELSD